MWAGMKIALIHESVRGLLAHNTLGVQPEKVLQPIDHLDPVFLFGASPQYPPGLGVML